MVPASEAEPGKLYKLSRSAVGGCFYEFIEARAARRVERRLADRPWKLLRTDELALLQALRRGERLAVRYLRGTAAGSKFEHEQYCSFPPEYELREIKRPLGFNRKRSRDEETES